MAAKPTKPTRIEIQRAHDILWATVMSNAGTDIGRAAEPAHAALDTLCWVLGDTHAHGFQTNLRRDLSIMASYTMVDSRGQAQ
jgi:hypothetical protein